VLSAESRSYYEETIMSTPNLPSGQAQEQTPPDPALAALKAQSAILAQQQAQMDARLKILQDQGGMLTGLLPASTATPQSGAVTVSGNNPFDSQELAYGVLAKVATAVASKVEGNGPILVYDQTEMNSLVNFKAVLKVLDALQGQVAHLKQTFTGDLDPKIEILMAQPKPVAPQAELAIAPILVPGLLLGGLKTLSDLMGMFRTNTSIAFSSFTADDVALTAAVVSELIAKGKEVYEPAAMSIDATNDASNFMTELSLVQNDLVDIQEKATAGQAKLQQLSDALDAFIKADQAVKANSDATKQTGLEAAQVAAGQFAQGLLTPNPTIAALPPLNGPTAIALKSQRDQFLKRLNLFVTSVSTTVATFNTLQTSLLAVTNTGSATLTAILRAEKLMDKVKTPGTTVLLLKTSVLGGSVVTRVNLFTGGHLLYTGGAIVNYTLFDSTGKVTASGVVTGNTAAKKADF
jgi:hypothetical protein